MNDRKELKLKEWLNSKIDKAKSENQMLFMGIPDKWFEHGLHCCHNGHINNRYLITDNGAKCLDCEMPSHIFPCDINQNDFQNLCSNF